MKKILLCFLGVVVIANVLGLGWQQLTGDTRKAKAASNNIGTFKFDEAKTNLGSSSSIYQTIIHTFTANSIFRREGKPSYEFASHHNNLYYYRFITGNIGVNSVFLVINGRGKITNIVQLKPGGKDWKDYSDVCIFNSNYSVWQMGAPNNPCPRELQLETNTVLNHSFLKVYIPALKRGVEKWVETPEGKTNVDITQSSADDNSTILPVSTTPLAPDEGCKLELGWNTLNLFSFGSVFGWVICEIAMLTRGIGNLLFYHGFNLLKDTMGIQLGTQTISEQLNALASGVVGGVWKSILSMINFAALAGLMVVAFANIFRLQIDTYAVKKALPALVAAIILANFSYMICKAVIDFSTVVTNAFLSGEFNLEARTSTSHVEDLQRVFNGINNNAPEIIKDESKKKEEEEISKLSEARLSNLRSIIHSTAIAFAGGLVYALGFVLMIRRYIIFFLVALSPLAFFGLAFPLAKKAWDYWWSNFMQWTFMGPIVAFWLWIASIWANSPLVLGNSKAAIVASYIFSVLCLLLAISTPFKMAGAFSGVMGKWAGLGKKTLGFVGRQAKTGTDYGWARYKVGAMAKGGKMAKILTGARRFKTGIETEKALYESSIEEYQKGLRKKRIGALLARGARDPALQRLAQAAATDLGGILDRSEMSLEAIKGWGKVGEVAERDGTLYNRATNQKLNGEEIINYFAARSALGLRARHSWDMNERAQASRMIEGIEDIFDFQKRTAKLPETPEQRKAKEEEGKMVTQAMGQLDTLGDEKEVTEKIREQLGPRLSGIEQRIKKTEDDIYKNLNQILVDLLQNHGTEPANAQRIISANSSLIRTRAARPEFWTNTQNELRDLYTDITGATTPDAKIIERSAAALVPVASNIENALKQRRKLAMVRKGVEFDQRFMPYVSNIHGRVRTGKEQINDIVEKLESVTPSPRSPRGLEQLRTALREHLPEVDISRRTGDQLKALLDDYRQAAQQYQGAGVAITESVHGAVENIRQKYMQPPPPPPGP